VGRARHPHRDGSRSRHRQPDLHLGPDQQAAGSGTGPRPAEQRQPQDQRKADADAPSLLAFAQRQPQKPRTVDIATQIRHTGNIIQPSLGSRVRLDIDAPTSLWPVRVDTAQFDSALLNLATNARDAMPDGGTLKITVRNETFVDGDQNGLPPGDYVRISVSDTGTGMSDDVAARVFEPFFTTKEAGKGTGLGLSMVHGFAAQSGGAASIQTSPSGTTVILDLPRAEAAAPVAVDTLTEPAEPGPALEPGGTVLVVEDDEDLREVVAMMLWSMGYDVVEAATGDLALPLLQDESTRIDLLFSDIVMDGHLDGIRLAKVARDLRKDLPIILTSGFPGDPGGLADLPDNIPLLRKPYPREELAGMIRRALRYN
jgi:CheY-like chemotaxis protein